MYPTDRRYSKEHEWILVEERRGTVGITHFAQDQLGDIVYVELPQKGKAVKRGEVLGTIESVKAVSEIYSPVSGTVAEANAELEAQPDLVNSDPHGKGWYCKIDLSEPSEVDELMEASAYAELAQST